MWTCLLRVNNKAVSAAVLRPRPAGPAAAEVRNEEMPLVSRRESGSIQQANQAAGGVQVVVEVPLFATHPHHVHNGYGRALMAGLGCKLAKMGIQVS